MEQIEEKDLLEQYKWCSAVYGTETNIRRMIPDVRDGLKLVQRRILFIMYFKQHCDTRAVKTVAVVGDTTKIHPHGDTSIADAITPLSNWFGVKAPLISSKSNMGSMQGGGAAAPRYTEIRLSALALECIISDLKQSKQVVDWVETFDNTDMEPEYFPTAIPLLLINGTMGLGFGVKTYIPSHNITEVIDATIKLIKNPDAPVVLVPDNCMNCDIIDTNWKAISNKGRGSYKVRSIIDIEQNKAGNYSLIIKSTPDGVSWDKGSPEKGGVKYKILEMIKNGKLTQIEDIDEDSHKNDMRIVIKLKKGSDPAYVRETLYKCGLHLEETFTVNFEVLKGLELVRMSYKSYLQYFIEQRKITKFRMYCNRLQNVRTKYHEKDAYVKVIESGEIDNIINLIKNQKTIDDDHIIEYIVKKSGITDIQARYIINANIKNLSLAYLKKYKEDLKILKQQDEDYMNKITNDDIILQEILDELTYFKKKFGEPRKCQIISRDDIESVPKGTFKIVITDSGYIKKMNLDDYVGAKNGDNPALITKIENTDNLLLFSEQGKVYKLPAHKIPFADKNSVGYDLRVIVKGLTSKVIRILSEDLVKDLASKVSKHFLVMVTEGNNIKKLDLDDVSNVPPSGIIYTKLNDGDIVKDIEIVYDKLDIIIYSDKKALRVNMKDIPHYKRHSMGVIAMNTKIGVKGLEPLYKGSTDILVVTNNGKVNKFDIVALASSDRGKAGSSVISLAKGDSINSIFGVNDNQTLFVVTKEQKLEIPIKDIKEGSSVSPGNKIISTRGDIIVRCEIMNK